MPAGTLRKAAREALSYLGFPDAELSVVITGDRRMRALNREFRGKDKTTDVLSFPAHEPGELARISSRAPSTGGPPLALGDVVISAPRAMVQSAENGNTFERELVFLLVHGMLHLVGHDHEAGRDAEHAMRNKQRELMARLAPG